MLNFLLLTKIMYIHLAKLHQTCHGWSLEEIFISEIFHYTMYIRKTCVHKNFSNRMLWLKKLCKNNWILWHGRVTEYHIDMTWSCYWRDIYLLQIDLTIRYFLDIFFKIRVITKLPNSEQSYKGKVKTRKYINRQNQSTIDSILSPSVVIQCVTVSDDLAW